MKHTSLVFIIAGLCLPILTSSPAWSEDTAPVSAPGIAAQNIPVAPPPRPQEFSMPGRWLPPAPPRWNTQRWMPPAPAIPNAGYGYPPANAGQIPAPRTPRPAPQQNPWQVALDASKEKIELLQSELHQTRGLLKDAGEALDWAHKGRMSDIEQHSVLVDSLAAITVERDALQEQVTALSAALDAGTETQADLLENLADLRAASTGLTDERTGLHDELKRCNETITVLMTEANASASELATLQLELASRDQQLAMIAGEVEIATAALQKTQSELNESHQQSSDTGLNLQACNDELGRLFAMQLDSNNAIASNHEQLLVAVTVRDQLQADLAACNLVLADARASLLATQAPDLSTTEEAPAAEAPADTPPHEQGTTPKPPVAASDDNPESGSEFESDGDGDGIPDTSDLCPGTQPGIAIEATGCEKDIPMTLEGVNFHYDSSVLNSESHAILDRVAGVLDQHPALKLEVAGHTDTQGDPAYNLWLSQERSDVVRDYLVKQGVVPENISARGYGSQQPVAENDTREGLARNRRVELRTLTE